MEFYCDVIMDEAEKMNRMVKNLLTLNQLEFGVDEIEFERFDLTEVIRGVLQSMDILAKQQEAKVIFHQEEKVYVWADEFKNGASHRKLCEQCIPPFRWRQSCGSENGRG